MQKRSRTDLRINLKALHLECLSPCKHVPDPTMMRTAGVAHLAVRRPNQLRHPANSLKRSLMPRSLLFGCDGTGNFRVRSGQNFG